MTAWHGLLRVKCMRCSRERRIVLIDLHTERDPHHDEPCIGCEAP